MIDGAREHTVVSDGVELATLEAGDPARPTLIFIHGYPDNSEIWRGVLELLAPRFHVVAYDTRGAGRSSAPRGPAAYDVARLGDDLSAVLAAFSADRPAHLVGHDWGGIQGWEFVADPRFDGRLASFTTVAGPSIAHLTEGLASQLRRGHLLDLAGRVRRSWYVFALCTPGIPTLAWRGALGRGGWDRYLRYVERVPADQLSDTLASDGVHGANLYRRNILWRVPRARPIRAARIPVQLIVPTGDHFISSRYYEGLERLAPKLRWRIAAGSHWLPRTQPELLSQWIREFVEQVDTGTFTSSSPFRRGGGVEQLDGRLALVTGAGSGIGRATARALAKYGARLLLVDRDADAAANSADLIGGAHTFTCDVADETAMQQLANTVIGEHGVPDIVVNNAGIGVSGSFVDTGFDDWRAVLDVNLMGVVHGCHLFAKALIDRGEGGHIVNIASAAAFAPSKDLPAYSASKAAVLMLSECLRAELLPYGIGVTAVCPGIVATDITRATKYVGHTEDEQARLAEQVTRMYQRRNFTPEQVAAEIIQAIAADRPVAVVTPEAKVMRALSRVAPGALRRLAGLDVLPA